jgi:hypothetical protein
MMRPIDLYQFTIAVARAAWRLENPFPAFSARDPDACLGHPLLQRLLGDRDPVQLGQLLAPVRPRRSIEIAISLPFSR